MIEVKDVCYSYEGARESALSHVDADFEAGKVYSIVGPNGAGKSTLLRLLNGLIPHFFKGDFSGRVMVEGMDTREATVAQLSRTVGLVFQNPENQLFSETVEDEVAFGPKAFEYGDEKARRLIERALEVTGLGQLKSVTPWALSGGERKKLSIAAVLATDAQFIALDEPTTGQDAWFREALVALLRDLARDETKGIIVVSHDIDWIVELNPDRVMLMEKGRLMASGKPKEVFADHDLLSRGGMRPPIIASASHALGLRNALTPVELAEEIHRRLQT